MSQNSIKILKNQSKRQKRKRFLLLSLIVLGVLLSCGLLSIYLQSDNPIFHIDDGISSKKQNKDHIEDLQGVELKAHDSNPLSSFDHIFSKDDPHKHETSSAQPPIQTPSPLASDIKKSPLERKQTKHHKLLANNTTKIEIQKKASAKIVQQPARTVKSVPSTKIKLDQPKTNKPFNKPFKIDSIDAIILLELDTPIPATR